MKYPSPNPVYDIHNPLGLKFNDNFENCVNPLSTYTA